MFKLNQSLKSLVLAATLGLTAQANAVTTGQVAPDFTLKNMQGENQKLSEQRGNIILINFWASWCGLAVKKCPYCKNYKISTKT